MREPVEPGFMHGPYSWPKRDLIERKCLGVADQPCSATFMVPDGGYQRRRCEECKQKLVKNIYARRKKKVRK